MAKREIPLKRENLMKLEKVLNLWKTKNIVEQVARRQAACKNKEIDRPVMFQGRKISRKD